MDVNEGRYRVVELGTEITIDEEGDKEDVEGNVELVAFKMFLQRGLNDIPVPANRAVVSFATDGHLRKALGTWNCIVTDESVFKVDADWDEVLDRMAMGVAETITEYELEVRMEPMPAWTFYDLDDLAGANSGRGCEVRFWSRSITRKERLNPSSSTSTCDRLTTLGGQPLRAEGLPANRPRVVGPERKYGT